MSVFTDMARDKGIEALELVEPGKQYDHYDCLHWFALDDTWADRMIPPDYDPDGKWQFNRATYQDALDYFTDPDKDYGVLVSGENTPGDCPILAAAIIGCETADDDVDAKHQLWDSVEAQFQSLKGYKSRGAAQAAQMAREKAKKEAEAERKRTTCVYCPEGYKQFTFDEGEEPFVCDRHKAILAKG